jgi:hypothetical protein
MGNLEKQWLEVIPLELLRAKEKLRFHPEKSGYVDVESEGSPDVSPDFLQCKTFDNKHSSATAVQPRRHTPEGSADTQRNPRRIENTQS